jgi:hypothetical protein
VKNIGNFYFIETHNIGTHLKGIEEGFQVAPLFFKSFYFWVISLFELFSKYKSLKRLTLKCSVWRNRLPLKQGRIHSCKCLVQEFKNMQPAKAIGKYHYVVTSAMKTPQHLNLVPNWFSA